jgi:hypothetical protein
MKPSNDYSKEEKIIAEAIIDARKVQEFIWQDTSLLHFSLESEKSKWVEIFQKRVDKISEIDFNNSHFKIELRKRLLQQAALSILALRILMDEVK